MPLSSFSISHARKRIDEIDTQIITLLAERNTVSGQIGSWKKAHKKAIFDPQREQELYAKITELAEQSGLDITWTQTIWQHILTQSKRIQSEL